MAKHKRCKRCGKRWCGTSDMLRDLYPSDPWMWTISYGKKKCRKKGPKR